jgi:hypothetical protein
MTDDVEIQYGNFPMSRGPAVRDLFENLFSKLDMLGHDIRYFDYVAPRIYHAATARYLVKGDSLETDVITLSGFAVFSLRKDGTGRPRCYRAEIFVDPSAVFQRIAEKFPSDA